MLNRILSDLRDLWTLITKGQPEVDPLLPWRMMADLAKFQPAPVDIDRWEAEQYARNPLAVWFDPDRYAGTKYDWPKRQTYAQGFYQASERVDDTLLDWLRARDPYYAGSLQMQQNAQRILLQGQLQGFGKNSYGNMAGSGIARYLGLQS